MELILRTSSKVIDKMAEKEDVDRGLEGLQADCINILGVALACEIMNATVSTRSRMCLLNIMYHFMKDTIENPNYESDDI